MTALTKQDIDKVIVLIKINYDKAYTFNSKEELSTLIDFWYDSLKEYPREVVYEATKRAIQSSEFAPKLATILAEIKKLICSNEPSDTELWDKIIKALPFVMDWRKKPEYIGTEYYHDWLRSDKEIRKIFDELPAECQAFLVDKINLIFLAHLWYESKYEQLSIEKSRFLKLLQTLREKVQSKQFMRKAGLLGTNDRKLIED